MNLSDRTIRILLANGHLRVDPHTDAMIQPSGVDLSLGDSLLVWPREILCDPRIDQTHVWQKIPLLGDTWTLSPGYRYLATTAEEIALADNLTGQIAARSKWGRCGLDVIQGPAGFCDAGYHGRPTLELSVTGSDLLIWPGAGCLQLVLTWQDKRSERPYGSDGLGSHYQGDMVPTPMKGEAR